MKVKTFYIPMVSLVIDMIVSLPQLPFDRMKIGGFSIFGAIRLLIIPLLVFAIFDISKKIGENRLKFSIGMSIPIIILLMLFGLQILAIPPQAKAIHLSGCAKFVTWILGYFCILLSLNIKTAPKIKNLTFLTLLLVFFATVIQYPYLIATSGASFSQILLSYGAFQKVKIYGLFGSANEDANALMTLFPFAIFYVEKMSGFKRSLFRAILLFCVPLIVFVNGTRTALFITFPIVVFLFYTNLSLKKFLQVTPLLLVTVIAYNLFFSNLTSAAFQSESEGGGTLDWRIEHVWTPTTAYTTENSPIFGFGSRGWEYVSIQSGAVKEMTEPPQPESAHNVYVWTYASWGIIGCSAHLLFIALLLKESFQLSKFTSYEVSMLGRASFCSIIAYCLWGSISNAYSNVGWVILIFIASLIGSLKVLKATIKVTRKLNMTDPNFISL
ncbi:O-antigen ligase family protein [Lyngbya aestuarii]|uniref:O-antigen ligase family protein n=1 Tax=Lyngbya aestuarii TaxID=118322 RepID=UPI00403D77A1